ncbi:MAG: class I SAM-dependent rRNA methyltransferase, partial [Alphaproteobacteria bacterium]
MSERARIRLRPGKGRRFLAGAPWAFADEIVMDRRTRALMPGSVAVLEDAGRSPIACVAFNPGSKIAVRRLDDDPAAEIGPAWLHERLARALRLRRRLFDDDVCRLVHAEADGLPGVIVDRYGDAAVIQPNAAWAEALAGALVDALIEVTGISKVVINRMGRARRLEGLGEGLDIAAGHLDGPLRVRMNGATYLADLTGGQKTGLFLDQRLNHAFSARLGRGLTVLDLFCHVGGFGLAALAGGAESVLAVDGSAEALELARAGAEASGVAERYRTRRGDGFETLRALAGEDRRFGMVVC